MTATARKWYDPIVLFIALPLAFAVVGALPTTHGGSLLHPQPALAATGKRVLPVGKKYPTAVERWRGIIRRYGYHVKGHTPGWWQQQALAIVWAESDGNPRCQTGSCTGLFQINCRAHHLSLHNLMEPIPNTQHAVRLYINEGCKWRPAWTTAQGLGLR